MMKKDNTDNIYYKNITFDNIYKCYNIVRRTCKNKKGVYKFNLNKNTNIYNIYKCLINKTYKPLPFKLFMIFEPKPRLVMSQSIKDKIVNHFIANYYLLPYLEKKLIDSNVATRKGKGSSYAEKLLCNYINEIRIKYPHCDIYALKIDISKYFYNIDHNILITKLEKDIKDKEVIDLIKLIISETNKSYINDYISIFNNKYNTDIPFYKKDVGLSIGAMTSQFLAIYYLNDLDHFIKEKLKCKYYIRYMDDFIIFDIDKENLRYVWKKVEYEIGLLKLKVNPKSNITKLISGFTFVGLRYVIENGRFKIKYKKDTIKKIDKKLNYLKENDLFNYYKSYASYYGYLSKIKRCERDFKMKPIEKYNYLKERKKNAICFIKEGSFYKTYKDDAIIVWNLFNYKWNKGSIGFGVLNSSKVFDYLKSLDIGYVIESSDGIIVKGNDEVYELYLRLSKINYDKYKKKEELKRKLNEILDYDINSYDTIKDYFNSMI